MLTDRQSQAFQVTGVMPEKTVQFQLSVLRKEGILVDLNITGTGIFTKALNWAELGIPDFADDRRSTQYTKGSKYLYPERRVAKLKSFESRARHNLEKNSYEVTGIKPYRWLPYTAYPTWREKHDQIVDEANQYIHDELVVCHDACVDEIASNYAEIADAAWLSLTTGESESGRRVVKYTRVIVHDKATDTDMTLGRDEFVDYIVKSAVSQIPSAAEIESKIKFDYTTALFYGQEDLAEDEAAAANIRAQVGFDRERANLEAEALRETVRKQAWDNQYDQQKKQEALEAMRQAEYEHHREQLKNTVSPFVEVYQAAMSQFADHAKDMLESISKNGHVRGKVKERGRGLLDIYNLMVLPGMGDDRMMQYLTDLRALLGNTEDTSTDQITAKLNDIVALEKAVTDALLDNSEFGYIEV